ncbi:MAG TPA: sialate O-acetylesterase, partial [Chitinophagaceae bacterium]|nr:sialate O-acetylesterase [Chitinophagaceae bacterium]
MKKNLLIAVAFVFALHAQAKIILPSVISSNMVLQQKSSVTIWGWSAPAEKIFITASWSKNTDSAVATRDAKWQLQIKTPEAGGPYTITIKGENTITLDNVMIGEVWVCSGQSNMEWSYYNGLKDINDELPNCYNKNIRFFHIPKTTAQYPQDDCKAAWEICDSNTLKGF